MTPVVAPPDPAPRRRGGRWPRRIGRASIALVAALALGWIAIHTWLNSDAMRDRVRGRLVQALGKRAEVIGIGDQLQVDWFGRVAFGPVTLDGSAKRAPVLEIHRVRVRPSYRALLAGEVKPATVRLERPVVDLSDRGARLREVLSKLRNPPSGAKQRKPAAKSEPSKPAEAATELEFVRLLVSDLEVRFDAEGGTYGPLDAELAVWNEPKQKRTKAQLQLPGGAEVRLEGEWEEQGIRASLVAEDFSAETVPSSVRERLPLEWSRGAISSRLELQADAKLSSGSVVFHVGSNDLWFSGERLSPEPVGPAVFGLHLDGRWATSGRKVKLENSRLTFGLRRELEILLEGAFSWDGEPRFTVTAKVDEPYEHLLAAIPAQLHPGAEAPKVKGTLSASLHANGPVRRPHEWTVEAKLDLSKLDEAEPLYLKQPFTWRTPDVDGRSRELWIGEKNPSFVAVAELPVHVIRAVTTSEDAGFFAHRGFDLFELKDSVISAAEDRRVRGASTITQQLAKNLFLSREKTYARKVKEALITLALEGTLSKQRLLEIYLNLIEWGPGIHGIGEASRYYFGVDPRQLTIKQAAYLATIIPNPVRYHVYYARGELTENWQKRLDDLLTKMLENGVITPEQLAEAQAAPLLFRPHG